MSENNNSENTPNRDMGRNNDERFTYLWILSRLQDHDEHKDKDYIISLLEKIAEDAPQQKNEEYENCLYKHCELLCKMIMLESSDVATKAVNVIKQIKTPKKIKEFADTCIRKTMHKTFEDRQIQQALQEQYDSRRYLLMQNLEDIYIDKNKADGQSIFVYEDVLWLEKNNVVHFNIANDSISLDDSIKMMSYIATSFKKNVLAKHNNVTFHVTPGMSIEEGTEAYDRAYATQQEEAWAAPEYKAKQEKDRQRKIAQKAKVMADNTLIENEIFEIDIRHKNFFDQTCKLNEGNDIVKYALRWGKLMQAEMKMQGLGHPTKEIIDDTDRRTYMAYPNISSPASHSAAKCFLEKTWKYGKELTIDVNVKQNKTETFPTTKKVQRT